MYYIIYKITNTVNGFVYIGQHVTDDIHDNYMGSGIRLLNTYAKYGTDIFRKEVLFVFDNFDEMDKKEAELVNEEFIRRPDTYNILLGGSGWCSAGTVTVELLETPGIFGRIPKERYDPLLHRYPTSGSTQVYLKSTGEKLRVTTEGYKKHRHLYNAISTGMVSVQNKLTGKTLSIPIDEYDPEIYTKVFGGIVVERNGTRQYISRTEFDDEGLSGVHKGKITAVDKETGIKRHVTQEEYYANPERYSPNGTGTTIVKDKVTGIRSRIPTSLARETPDKWIVGTTGWATVYDIETSKWMNVPAGTLDRAKHRLSQDKKFICYNSDGSVRFEYWGSKVDFLRQYKCPVSVWEAVIRQETFRSDRIKSNEFNGCQFALIDWKKSRG